MLARRARRGRAVLLPAPNWHALVPALTALHAPPPAAPPPPAAAPAAAAAPKLPVVAAPPPPPPPPDQKADAKSSGTKAAAVAGAGGGGTAAAAAAASGANKKKRAPTRQPVRKPIVAHTPVSVLTRHISALRKRIGPQRPTTPEAAHWSLTDRTGDAVADKTQTLRRYLRAIHLQNTTTSAATITPGGGATDAAAGSGTAPPPAPPVTAPHGVPRHWGESEWQLRVARLHDALLAVQHARSTAARAATTNAPDQQRQQQQLLRALQRAGTYAWLLHDWQRCVGLWRDSVVTAGAVYAARRRACNVAFERVSAMCRARARDLEHAGKTGPLSADELQIVSDALAASDACEPARAYPVVYIFAGAASACVHDDDRPPPRVAPSRSERCARYVLF